MVSAQVPTALHSVSSNNSPRDQELRFTVHESPDYYKLKCSVFNEDKKNDLIGEVWMDLKEVIVPGGGQNDIWHQLQFKGKYAGEIRVELTYYDTRPKDESALEQRRGKERSHANSGGSPAAVGGPRQPGPREVRRRPLPQGPPGSSPAVRPPQPEHVHSSPIPALHSSPSYHEQPDRRDIWAPDRHYHSGIEQPVSNYENSYATGREDQRPVGDNYALSSIPDFEQIQNTNPSFSDHIDFEQTRTRTEPNEPTYHPDFNAFPPSPATHSSYHTPSQGDRRHSAQPAFPPQDIVEHSPSAPYGSSPPIRSSPGMVRSAPESGDPGQRVQFNHYSTSHIRTDMYRDSPLRQSISNHDIEPEQEIRASSPDGRPPPPPPAHGQRLPSSRPPSNTYQDTNTFQIPRKLQASSPTYCSPDARSPLQTIERNFDPYYQPNASPLPPFSSKQDSYEAQDHYEAYSKPGHGPYEPPSRSQTFPRPNSNRENNPPLSAGGYDGIPTETDEPLSYGFAEKQRSWNGLPPSVQSRGPLNQGRPNHAYDFPDTADQQRTYQSQPRIVRPRAISPGAQNIPPRKSISPHPSSPSDDRGLGGVPFGPDSYDILNPIASPTVAESTSPMKVETPEQLKEAARLHEVEKPREQGPIIGNDGREIDPSDHLPSDTWAPEPERKTRKPEVVIRFRKKEEAIRTPIKFGSSPTSSRPLSMPIPVQGSSPYSVESPSSGAKVGRNRLQKQMPSRPLPIQPFQHSHSSPAVPVAPRVTEFNTPSPGARLPPVSDFNIHSSGSRVPARPALSEYSVMANRGYGSSPYHYGYEPSPPPIPAKVPFYAAETPPYRPHGNMDPFAVEISSIDIGGSGGRRSGGRPRRVFEV
jgi:hypothetical protein